MLACVDPGGGGYSLIKAIPGHATEQGPFLGIFFINRVSILREIVIDFQTGYGNSQQFHKQGTEIPSLS